MGNSMPSMLLLLLLPRCEVMANEHEHVAYRSRKRASAVTFLSIAHISLYFPISFSFSLSLFRLHSHPVAHYIRLYSSFVSHTYFTHTKIVPRVMTMVSNDLFLLFGFCSLPSHIPSAARRILFFSNFFFSFFWFVCCCWSFGFLFVSFVIHNKLTQFRATICSGFCGHTNIDGHVFNHS